MEKRKKVAKGFFKGFKDFISKGNVIDLSVAVVIGAAFGKIVTSFTKDIIMPPIGLLIGGVDFKDLVWQIKAATLETEAVNIAYGSFIMTVLEFLIIAFAIYTVLNLVIRRKQFIEKLEQEEQQTEESKEEVVVEPSEEIVLLREIRDSLKNKN